VRAPGPLPACAPLSAWPGKMLAGRGTATFPALVAELERHGQVGGLSKQFAHTLWKASLRESRPNGSLGKTERKEGCRRQHALSFRRSPPRPPVSSSRSHNHQDYGFSGDGCHPATLSALGTTFPRLQSTRNLYSCCGNHGGGYCTVFVGSPNRG
jgi:hypothetical protein